MVEFGRMKTRNTLSRDQWAGLILGLSLIFGLMVRLFPGLMTGFPLNDGGMFLVMIRDLRSNDFALPEFTRYNFSDIPFVYPPFGLYVAAWLNSVGLPEMDILRWLPVAVNFLSIPAFYLLAAALLDDRPRAAVATAFFALTAGSYSWQIMGGGVTRSFGMVFLLLALVSVHRMFRQKDWKVVPLSILSCSLAVLSHPEVGLAAAAGCALLWLMYGRSLRGSLQAGTTALGTLILTSLWWGTALAQHGPAPFLSVLHSGAYVESPFVGLYSDIIAPAALFTLAGVLRAAGLVWAVKHRQYFPVLWLVLPYFVEPRSAVSFIASSLLIAIGLMDALPNVLDWMRTRSGLTPSALDFTQRPGLNFLLLGIIFYLFLGSALYDFRLINTSLVPPDPQAAFDWARRNTPPDSEFLILTGLPGIMTDPIQEWFPALAERRSQTTLQGLEWTLGAAFFPRLEALVSLQECRVVACVEAWSAETGLGYSHVLVQRTEAARLLDNFKHDPGYRLIFENTEVSIFER